jgi:hypothetical protein
VSGCGLLLDIDRFHDCGEAGCPPDVVTADAGEGGADVAEACSTDDAGLSVGCALPAPVCSHGACVSIKSLARGGLAQHSCALLSDGRVRCWGANNRHQLGAGASDGRFPVEVPQIADAVEGAVGGDFSCARVASGDVFCWGSDAESELGDDAGAAGGSSALPVKVGLPQDAGAASAIAAGLGACAVVADGSVWCWGANDWGQLGCPSGSSHLDKPIPYLAPYPLTPATPSPVKSLAIGSWTACFSSAPSSVSGAATCYGDPRNALGDGYVVYNQYCYVTQGGAVEMSDGADGGIPLGAFDVLSSGDGFTCGVFGLGTLVPRAACWGQNDFGQADGTDTNVSAAFYADEVAVAQSIVNAGVRGISNVTAGAQHACAVAVVGDGGTAVECWGRGDLSQGTSGPGPLEIKGLVDVVDLQGRDQFTCALQKNGDVKCWGRGSVALGIETYELLGNGAPDTQADPVSVKW